MAMKDQAGEQNDGKVPRTPATACEKQRRVKQGERGPPGNDLMQVEPDPIAARRKLTMAPIRTTYSAHAPAHQAKYGLR